MILSYDKGIAACKKGVESAEGGKRAQDPRNL